ncbi:MAG: twin-arginine translocation signal domain-containing protein [Paludibacter sp.]|jgi:hypothetical protein|nr:twin-arginine translocation signal domain-containing protein [Paludibacter sp.]
MMDAFESNRRDFLKKLGIIIGATALSGTGLAEVATDIMIDKKDEAALTPEQSKFMVKYKQWLDKFHDMAKFQKTAPNDIPNNTKLMQLSLEAEDWQKELIGYMKDENFARYFMIVTKDVTHTI